MRQSFPFGKALLALPLLSLCLCLAGPALGQADLSVTITDSPDPVAGGGKITYVITATNNGPAAADSMVISLSPIPGDTTLDSITPSTGGSCLPGEATCTFSGSISSGQTRSITVVVKVENDVSIDDLIEATAVVQSGSPDPNTSNNSASTTTRIGAPGGADLSLAKTASASSVAAGATLTYALVARNNGPGESSNVLVSDPLPSGVVFTSLNDVPGWFCSTPLNGSAGTVECRKTVVASGEVATFNVGVRTLTGISGNVTNTARISSSATVDPNGGNDASSATITVRGSACGTAIARLIPVVLDVDTGVDHFTTEVAFTNRGTTTATLSLRYTASVGAGSGTVTETLPAGRQLIIPDIIAYLRSKNLAIPPVSQGQQVGTLLVTYGGVSDPAVVAATARTTAAVKIPEGAAGLAYSGIDPCEGLTGTANLFGLRSTTNDRTNVAVFNTTDQPVTVKISLTSGDPLNKKTVVVRDGLTLDAYGWNQVTRIFDNTGLSNGFATVERTSSGGAFGTYAVINNNFTGDGSFLLPVTGTFIGNSITEPVVVETLGATPFRSELVLSNKGASEVDLTISYLESLDGFTKGRSGSFTESLGAGEQKIIPNAVDYLRDEGIPIGPEGGSSYAGSIRVTTSASLADVYVGARTAAQSGFVAGGEFGLFTAGVYPGQEASTEAFLYGLQANTTNRTNIAVLHAGGAGSGAITLEIQIFDGDAAGVAKGSPEIVTLEPGGWTQIGNILKLKGVANGWARVRRTAGTAPWVTYGVINDGGNPGERTGDGAFIPMVK